MGFTDYGRTRIGEQCKDCQDRHLGCHDSCDKYQDALAEYREKKATIRKAKMPTEHDLYKFDTKIKIDKRKHYDGKR